MAFSFGSAAPAAPGATPSPTAGFSFGGSAAAPTPAAAAATAPAATAPAATAAGGFSFGGSTTPAPAAATAPAPAALPTLGFGAPPTGNTSLTNAPTTPSPTASTALRVPDYDTVFSGTAMATKIQTLLTALEDTATADGSSRSNKNNNNSSSHLAGQELVHLLTPNQPVGQALLQLQPCPFTAPCQQTRQQLAQQKTVFLTSAGKEAALTDAMLQTAFDLSDRLRISEPHALSLYARAVAAPRNPTAATTASTTTTAVTKVAHALYFADRGALLQTLLVLLQHRTAGHPAVVQATDGLLQNEQQQLVSHCLLKFIQQGTAQIDELQRELRRIQQQQQQQHADQRPLNAAAKNSSSPAAAAARVHYEFAVAQRQTAAECLFFVAYTTQLTELEVVVLLDLVRDLSNGNGTGTDTGLVILDPFVAVPDPFLKPSLNDIGAQPTWPFANAPQPPQHEKDAVAWQQELVQQTWETGQPQLLRAVSTLVTTIVCALDARNVLMDRLTHQPNVFGTGNQLLPPHTSNTDSLANIHSRLTREAVKDWQRPDILGVLMTAFGMLLRTAPSALSSPRSGAASLKVGSIDIRKCWRECLEAPIEFGSFTAARLSLLPALQKPGSSGGTCQVAEFFTTVLAEFTAHYLDVLGASGERPISRAKWEQEAEEELRLRRSHQEQQQQFQAWSGTSAVDEEVVPAVVDLMKRPDCMDDVIAFAVAIGSLGSEYALRFWSQEDHVDHDGGQTQAGTIKLVASRALRELERQQTDDDSLRPCYLSFLAVLALAEAPFLVQNGAAVIHEILSSQSDQDSTLETNWESLIGILRWYVRELSPQDYGSTSSSSATSTSGGTGASTAYYYHADRSMNESMAYGSSRESSRSESTPSRAKPRELSDDNTFVLLSHLAVIGKVASKSPSARSAILSVNLPIQSPDGTEVVGQDSALMVLFTLAGAPLSPELRGAVFETIANILQTNGSSKEESDKMREMAIKGWELLEACQILPIHLLDQYPSIREADAQNIPGIAFPPSSTAMVKDKAGKSWIPPDPRYAIVFEMEHIESAMGVYPSTCGFLRLLHALFTVGGSPANLGENWRVRCGCAPYIEYVIHLVLPRVTGRFPSLPSLPFRSVEDKSRISALALAVVETLVTSYAVPATIPASSESMEMIAVKCHRDTQAAAREQLGHRTLADTVTVAPIKEDAKLFMEDFRSKSSSSAGTLNTHSTSTIAVAAAQQDQWTMSAMSRSMAPSVPRPKAPGFAVIVEILSSTGNLFNLIASILVSHQSVEDEGLEADKMALAFAMFGSTPPTFASMKASSKKGGKSPSRQTLLKTLRPRPDSPTYSCAADLREQGVLRVLRIICAVLSREDLLHGIMNATHGQSSIVPVLRFRNKSTAPSRLVVHDLQLSKVANLLLSAENGNQILYSVVDFVGYTGASSSALEVDLAAAAVGILFYVGRSQHDFGVICRVSEDGSAHPARSFARRLMASAERCNSIPDAQLLRMILERLLQDLRSGVHSDGSFAHIMLGLPGSSFEVAPSTSGEAFSEKRTGDCFDALLKMLSETNFVTADESAEFASCCFEICFRVCELTVTNNAALQRVLFAVNKLRGVDFWKAHVARMLLTICHDDSYHSPNGASTEALLNNEHILHSLSWILRGTAIELKHLLGRPSWSHGGATFGSIMGPQPSQYKELVSLLFAPPYDFVVDLLRVLPIERISFDTSSAVPSEAAVRGAKYNLPGAEDVVRGYEMINGPKLAESMKNSKLALNEEALRKWADQWNVSIARDCAVSHLTSALHVLMGVSFAGKELAVIDLLPDTVDGYKLLTHLLERFTTSGVNGTRSGLKLDDAMFTTATRNLALSVLATTEYVVSKADRIAEGNGCIDGPATCALLACAVVSSGFGSGLSPNSTRINERTAILTTALALMLQHLSREDVRDVDLEHYFSASVIVSRLAGTVADSRIPVVPTTEALVARSCLSLLLELFGSEPSLLRAQSPVQAVLVENSGGGTSESPIKVLVRLVASLDGQVASFLQKVAHLPFGGDALLETGVIEALQTAAETYKAEESRVRISHRNDVAYDNVSIVTPSFLLGHLGLMSTLMATELFSDRSRDLPSQIMKTLRIYDSVFERLVSRFPVDGDVLQSCFRCIAQAQSFFSSTTGDGLRPLVVGGLLSDGAFISSEFDNTALVLTMHIAENPFPRDILSALPSRLSRRYPVLNMGAVSMSTSTEKSWWEAMNVAKAYPAAGWVRSDSKLTEEMYDYSALGADMLSSGLCLVRGVKALSLLDEPTLSRALCRCVNAVRMIDTRIQSASSTWNTSNNDGRDWKLLQSKWEDTVTELLLIVLKRTREIKNDQFRGSSGAGDDFGKLICFAIEHTGLETSGIGSCQTSVADENRPNYAMELSRALRTELQY